MKKVMLGLTAMALIFAACKKDDASPETYYLTKMIEVGEDGNDTTFISYNADNTFKEILYSYTSNGAVEFYAQGPVYEGGKITGIQERDSDNPANRTTRSFVYTAGVISKVTYYGDANGDGVPDTDRYDSLVYTAGKLTEFYALNAAQRDYPIKYTLTWEGNNVKTASTYFKQPGTEYTLHSISKYTYDNKPAFQQLLGNFQWLNDLTSFDYLSANNVTKEEVFNEENILRSTYTNVYTYEGNLLKMVDSEDKYIEPATTETYKVKLEYTTK